MSLETTKINPLIEGYTKIVKDLFKYSGTNGPNFPCKEALLGQRARGDGDTFFVLLKLLYDQNPEPMREAILHVFNEKIEHEVCQWSKRITDNEPSRNCNGITRYEEKQIQIISFSIHFADALQDKILIDRIYSSLQENKEHKKFFILKDYYCSAYMLFGYAPEAIKKKLLDRMIDDTKKTYPKKYVEMVGDFIAQKLRVVKSMDDRSLHYIEFFNENYSIEERGVFLSWMIRAWSARKHQDYMRAHTDLSEHFSDLTKFHPAIKTYFESLANKAVEKSSLEELSKERFFNNIKNYKNDSFKRQIASMIYLKCKSVNVDFFTYIKPHAAALGKNNVERLANFT